MIFRAVLDFISVDNFDIKNHNAMYQRLEKMQFQVALCWIRQVCSLQTADVSPRSLTLRDVSGVKTTLSSDERGETSAVCRLAGLVGCS